MKPKYLLLPILMLLMAWFAVSNESTVVMPTDVDQSIVEANASEPRSWDESVFEDEKPTLIKTVAKTSDGKLSPIERIKQMSNKSELHLALLEDHQNYERYPPENRRFESHHQDPITQRYAVDERTTLNEDKSYGLTIWSDKKYYLQTDQAIINAYVTNAEGKKVSAKLNAQLLMGQKTLSSIDLDTQTGDQVYQATLDLSSSSLGLSQPGIYKVLIRDEEHDILDALTFTLSKPDIQLTGDFRDSLTSTGALLIEAEVEVTNTNKFYVQASLYSSTNVPVGITQLTQQLSSGKHWIPLEFSGLMIRDSQESGPYVLQQLSLAKVTMPMQRAPVEQPGYQTDAYALDEFSSTPYGEQDSLGN
ncbi:hypothetical protein ACFOEK_10660 [Litoribrevibacter euphylliae]|uniref:DUF4785 domain-containing protein n=1 Tax=Litoribrevibacter euphylliae TaxID=1834034 RepID=A0ABV7HC52_9GAMM